MARAIRFLIENEEDRVRVAEQGHAVFQENFTESQIVDQYMKFFEERLKG